MHAVPASNDVIEGNPYVAQLLRLISEALNTCNAQGLMSTSSKVIPVEGKLNMWIHVSEKYEEAYKIFLEESEIGEVYIGEVPIRGPFDFNSLLHSPIYEELLKLYDDAVKKRFEE